MPYDPRRSPRGMSLRPLALAAALMLMPVAGCSSEAGTRTGEAATPLPTAAPGPHNATDEAYAHELVTMHQQAVGMARMAGSKDVGDAVSQLAAEVGQSRGQQMVSLGYLAQSWGIKPHAGDFHGNPGELTEADLQALSEVDGADFEELWLARVVDNYRGSVAMCRAELDGGLSVAGRQYARDVIEALETQLGPLEQALG